MPQIRSKQIIGDTPVKPTDLTTKEYVDSLIGSGVTSTLTIQDENSEVLSGVTIINFIGADVSATVGGLHQVNIYIPPINYSPNFNSGTSVISDIPTTQRYISSPTLEGSPFKIGDWVSGVSHSTIRNSVTNLIYSTSSAFSIFNLLSTFDAIVYDADGITELSMNTITITGNTVVSSSGITITVSSWSTDADRYKAIISVNINISSILPNGGRFSVKLIHHNNGIDYSYTQNNIFRDTENLLVNIGGTLTITTGTTVVTKQISGVYFYTNNTQWNVKLDNINNLNSRSYPITQQLLVTDVNLFCSDDLSINGNSGGFELWTNIHDNSGTTYNKLDWTTNQLNLTNWNGSGLNNTYASASVYDWSLVSTINSINYNYLIDTLSDSLSNRHVERFRTENIIGYPRLTSGLTTWDSSQLLNIYDGGNGLQVIGDKLVYPQYDFSIYEPNNISQPIYTGLTGDKYYYRKFETDGNDVYNGYIVFSDYNITEIDIDNDDIKIELSIDGILWLDIKYEFDININGCRANKDTYNLTLNNSLYFTFQNFTPINYTRIMYMKITYTHNSISKYIGGMDITGTYWT